MKELVWDWTGKANVGEGTYQGGDAEVKRRVICRETFPEPPKMRAVWVMVESRFLCEETGVWGTFFGFPILTIDDVAGGGLTISTISIICILVHAMPCNAISASA